MENSVNQSETGSTKIYAVNWIHRKCDEFNQEWMNHYTKYFNSEEEAKEFGNEDNLISIYEKWGTEDCNPQEYGWNNMYFDPDIEGYELDEAQRNEDQIYITIKEIELDKIILTPILEDGNYFPSYVKMGFDPKYKDPSKQEAKQEALKAKQEAAKERILELQAEIDQLEEQLKN